MYSSFNLSGDKSFRILNIYERLTKNERVSKRQLADDFNVSLKTIQRDIEDLRAYFTQTHFDEGEIYIKYDKTNDNYYLVKPEREWLTNQEVLAVCKILLESRAFKKDEIDILIRKLLMQTTPQEKRLVERLISNEQFYYTPLQHNKSLFEILWRLSDSIYNQQIIGFSYTRQDGRKTDKLLKPVSIMFSEFYFYLIAFDVNIPDGYPVVLRIDRIENLNITNEHFEIPYKDKFNEGEFRKRVQFMYSGELKRIKFEYSGVLEAILDRLPTVKILSENNGTYIMTAEVYGDGAKMWLNAQGKNARLIE